MCLYIESESRPFLYHKHLLLQVCENWRLSLILPSDTGDVKASRALDKVKAYLEKHCQSNLFIELCIEISTSAI